MAKISKIPLSEVLIENSTFTRGTIKKRLISELGWDDRCSMPGCPSPTPVWRGEVLTLQLDHINGINTDNRVENLRIICPNCHSQTDTYCGRGRRSSSVVRKIKTSKAMPTETVERIVRLARESRFVRTQHLPNDPRVLASNELNELLSELRDKGYTLKVLAEVAGMTPASVYRRTCKSTNH